MLSPAVILLSGGLDSATVLAMARADGRPCLALTFDYAQRHRHELHAAARIADAMGVLEHRVVTLDPRAFAGSALTPATAGPFGTPAPGVPHDRSARDIQDSIPVTYVPARNLVFLAIAVATAESIHADQIHIGVNALDYSGYPDCRPDFIHAFAHAARLGTRTGAAGNPISIHAPLIDMTKAQIIRAGASLALDHALTTSCYDPVGPDQPPRACGTCDACILRRHGFAQAGMHDPTPYASPPVP